MSYDMLLAVRRPMSSPLSISRDEALVSQPAVQISNAVKDNDVPALLDVQARGLNLQEPCTWEGLNPLQLASKLGYIEVVKWLIQQGADVNTGAGSESGTPVQLAAQYGHTLVVELLLRSGADIHAEDGYGSTALLAACTCCRKSESVRRLLECGADPNSSNHLGQTPLWLAVQEASSSTGSVRRTLALLLAAGADPTIEDACGTSSYDLAFHSCRTASIQLINQPPDDAYDSDADDADDSEADKADTTSSSPDSIGVLQQLLASHLGPGVEPMAKWELCLRAVRMGISAAAQQILDMGGLQPPIDQGDEDGATLLHYAAAQGWAGMVQQLLQLGATADVELRRLRTTPLYYAVAHNSDGVVQALLAGGANPFHFDWEGLTPFHRAASNGKTGMVQRMLAAAQQQGRGALVDLLTQRGQGTGLYAVLGTALHLAALRGHLDVVQVLLNSGADRAAKDSNGATAFAALCKMGLIVGWQFGTPAAAGVLAVLAQPKDLNALHDGQTPLQQAMNKRRPELAAALVAAGAPGSLVLQDNQGCTLFLAAAQRCVLPPRARKSTWADRWLQVVLAMLRQRLPSYAKQQQDEQQQQQQQQEAGHGQPLASSQQQLIMQALYMMWRGPAQALSNCLAAVVEILGAGGAPGLWADLLAHHAALPEDQQAPGVTLVTALAQGCLLAYPPRVEQLAATLPRLQQLFLKPGAKPKQQAKGPIRMGKRRRRKQRRQLRAMQAATLAEYKRQAAAGGNLVQCLRGVEQMLRVEESAPASALQEIAQAAAAGQTKATEVGPQAAALCKALLAAWSEGGRALHVQRQLVDPTVEAVQLWEQAELDRRGRGGR
jgi:ankyrin repeat protein